jgi:hypothetical protein
MSTSTRRRIYKLLDEFANLVKVAALDAGIVMSTIRPGFPICHKSASTQIEKKSLTRDVLGGRGLRGDTLFRGSLSGFPELLHVNVRDDFVLFASEKEEWYPRYFRHQSDRSPFFATKDGRKVIQPRYSQTNKVSFTSCQRLLSGHGRHICKCILNDQRVDLKLVSFVDHGWTGTSSWCFSAR